MSDGVVLATGVVATGSPDPTQPTTGTTITATTQFVGPAGAVGTPSYSFTGALTSGWYFSGGSLRGAVGGANTIYTNAISFGPGVDGTIDLGINSLHWKRLYMDYTNTGTVGAVTINKASGRINLAAAGTSIVLTNSLITAASHVFAQLSSAPGNAVAVSLVCVPAAGSVTITATPAVTNQTSIDFFVVNAD